jgi:mono/diheme cytochrome c family protein
MNNFLERALSRRTGYNRAESVGSPAAGRLRGILPSLVISTAAICIPALHIARAQAPGAPPKADNTPAGNVQNGKRIFEVQACSSCHGGEAQGVSNKEIAAPRIGPTRLSQRLFIGFMRNPTGKMPPYASSSVSDAELTDLYAFLQSLAPPAKAELSSANAQTGQRLYTKYGCYECHGNEGQGSVMTGGSRIGPVRIPFLAFAAYIRQPANQMPPYAVKAVSDAELADIYAFLLSRRESTPAKSIPLLNQ